jgi:hypothetical protein
MNGTDHLSDEERYALEAAEAALSGGDGASNHAELGALSRLLIRTTPKPDPSFADTLEKRLVEQYRSSNEQSDGFSWFALTGRASDQQASTGDEYKQPQWRIFGWLGRGVRRSFDAAITVALLSIFFLVFLWPSLRPARRETTFYYHMPDGLTQTELYGEDAPPQPVTVNGQTLWRSLTLAEVQTLVDYPVLAPTILDDVRYRGGYYNHSTGGVVAHYTHPDANQTFTLIQQPIGQKIDESEKLPIGPEAGVETLRLNGVKAEYVQGAWDTDLESSYYLYLNRFENPLSLDWDSILRLHWASKQGARILRWEKDGILYTLEVFDTSQTDPPRVKPGTLYLDQAGMVQLAESLQ